MKNKKKKPVNKDTKMMNLDSQNQEELTVDNFDIIESMTKTSYCFKCNMVKPPRAHHCKECNKCVYRMDHHCPWVANCVGQQNHKHFILFLLYASISCGIVCVSIGLDYMLGATVRNKLSHSK